MTAGRLRLVCVLNDGFNPFIRTGVKAEATGFIKGFALGIKPLQLSVIEAFVSGRAKKGRELRARMVKV